jgi:hypothetical protein
MPASANRPPAPSATWRPSWLEPIKATTKSPPVQAQKDKKTQDGDAVARQLDDELDERNTTGGGLGKVEQARKKSGAINEGGTEAQAAAAT